MGISIGKRISKGKSALLLLLIFSGCYKNHLYVQQEWIDRNFLASTHVGTPDPRQEHPPEGQKLLIGWDFPKSWFSQDLSLIVTVRLWDNTQEVFFHPVQYKRDYTSFYFPCAREDRDTRILTYRVQVANAEGKIIETWEHQFWTELIDVDQRTVDSRETTEADSRSL